MNLHLLLYYLNSNLTDITINNNSLTFTNAKYHIFKLLTETTKAKA